MVHEKDGAGDGDSQQYSHEEQDGTDQVAAAHSLSVDGRREEGIGQMGEKTKKQMLGCPHVQYKNDHITCQ